MTFNPLTPDDVPITNIPAEALGRTRGERMTADEVRAQKPAPEDGTTGGWAQGVAPMPRRPDGRVQAVGRDGQVLRRRQAGQDVHDKFHIPDHMIDPEWDLQWCLHDVAGQTDYHVMNNWKAQGFTEVQAERFPGMFMAPGTTGFIIVDGLILMERPKALGDEARAEERWKALNQMTNQKRHLNMADQLGQGFEQSGKYRGTTPYFSNKIAPGDAPRPVYQIADGD